MDSKTDQLISLPLWGLGLLVALILYGCSFLLSALRPGLRNIPGPLWAKFSGLYMAKYAMRQEFHMVFNQLHDEYGPIVRYGPQKVSIADPDVLPVIFAIGSGFLKAPLYDTFRAGDSNGVLDNLFATRDTVWHRHMRSVVAPAYSLSYLRHLEPLVDECTAMFMATMQDLAGQSIDLGDWFQWDTFDAIGNITFSQTFDFIKNRGDRLDIINGIAAGDLYQIVVSQFPGLHQWLLGNPSLVNILMRVPAMAKANPFITLDMMAKSAMSASRQLDFKIDRGNFVDFLKKAQAEKPGSLSDMDILTSLLANLFAGSDTTAISMRAVSYFLVKNPDKYRKLQEEIDEAEKTGNLGELVSFEQGSRLNYLQAVIKETMRLHPAVSCPLERVVPAEGAFFCNNHLPPGTVVGVNAWVIHRNKAIFGSDASRFRPERWLNADAETLKKMNHAYIPFGGGSRTCVGRHISMLELTKLIPTLLRSFSLEWTSEKEEWHITGGFFARQSGLYMRLNVRGSLSTQADKY